MIIGYSFVFYREVFEGYIIAPVRGTFRHPFWASIIGLIFMIIMVIRIAAGDVNGVKHTNKDAFVIP